MAARYLARAVALPPSNTSWYMGLSNGAAGLCESSITRAPACSPCDTCQCWCLNLHTSFRSHFRQSLMSETTLWQSVLCCLFDQYVCGLTYP